VASSTWLTDDEQATWRALVAVDQLLFQRLDQQLQRDAAIPHAYYVVLVSLSEAPERTLRMSELADRTGWSRSRLSHAIARLEDDGWIRRGRCPTDGRGTIATLTGRGFEALGLAAPGHVAEVRRLVFDRLDEPQRRQLHDILVTLRDGLETES
jgi:DNA-binding MarR family transcriptional regulator